MATLVVFLLLSYAGWFSNCYDFLIEDSIQTSSQLLLFFLSDGASFVDPAILFCCFLFPVCLFRYAVSSILAALRSKKGLTS